MTAKEILKILSVLKASYPSHYRGMTESDLDTMIEVWHEMFAEAEYPEMDKAVREYILTDKSGFPPSIGQLNHILYSRNTAGAYLTPQAASELVAKAVSRSGWHEKEEFEKLPPIIQSIVRTPRMLHEWSQLEASTFHTVILSNFQRSYQTAMERQQEIDSLPSSLKPKDPALAESVNDLLLDFGNKLKLS